MMKAFVLALMMGLATITLNGHASEADNKEALLETRVAERWERLMDKDFAGAYEYLTPAYRSLYTLEAYKSKLGVSVKWLEVKINGLKIVGNTALATIDIGYELNVPGPFSEELGAIRSQEVERWIWVADNWWLVELKVNGI